MIQGVGVEIVHGCSEREDQAEALPDVNRTQPLPKTAPEDHSQKLERPSTPLTLPRTLEKHM